MPRKVIGKRLDKVVSTTLSVDDFILLEKASQKLVNKKLISQPTISHVLRSMVERWAKKVREMSKKQRAQLRSILFKLPIILIQVPTQVSESEVRQNCNKYHLYELFRRTSNHLLQIYCNHGTFL